MPDILGVADRHIPLPLREGLTSSHIVNYLHAMLTSVEQVIEALGGTFKAAEAAKVGPSAVSNWKTRGRIPSDRFFVITDALRREGKAVSPGLFGFAAADGGEAA
jgi:hypothetical protein